MFLLWAIWTAWPLISFQTHPVLSYKLFISHISTLQMYKWLSSSRWGTSVTMTWRFPAETELFCKIYSEADFFMSLLWLSLNAKALLALQRMDLSSYPRFFFFTPTEKNNNAPKQDFSIFPPFVCNFPNCQQMSFIINKLKIYTLI